MPALLRAARAAAGLSQPEVSRRTGVSQARLSRAENGTATLRPSEVDELAEIYGVDPQQRRRLVDLAADAEAGYRDARTVIQRGNTARLQARFAALEARAAVVRSFQPVMVLGVLQSPAYAAAVFGTEQDDPLVVDRVERTRRLLTESERRWVLVQTEGALRWLVRSPQLMAEQVQHIVDLVDRPNVDFGLIPWSTPVDVVPVTGFHLYDAHTAVVGTSIGAAFVEDVASLRDYEDQFSRLVELASFGADARLALRELAEHYIAMW
jgi:transcriptional regulator with XRE-family HTH domain